MLQATTQWDEHGIKSTVVDAIGNICHKPPRTLYGIQMVREELQFLWVRNPISYAKRNHKSHTSSTNKPHKYSKKKKSTTKMTLF
jgi:hypothetical protein